MVGVCPHLLQNRGQKEPGVTQQLPPLQIICFTPPCCSYSCTHVCKTFIASPLVTNTLFSQYIQRSFLSNQSAN